MAGTMTETRWTGPFTSGEIPLPFTVKFDPTSLDYTGYTLAATLVDDDGTEMAFAGSVGWNDITTGVAEVQLGAADVVVPAGKLIITRRLMVWAGNTVNRTATLEIKFNCRPAVGTPPAI